MATTESQLLIMFNRKLIEKAECAKLVCKINESRGIALNACVLCVLCVLCAAGCRFDMRQTCCLLMLFLPTFSSFECGTIRSELKSQICWNANDGCHTNLK